MRVVATIFCALTILAGERVSADSTLFDPYVPQDYPDLVSVNGDVVYDKTMGDTLSIEGFADRITFSPAPNDFEKITEFGGTGDFGGFSLNTVIAAGAELDGEAVTGTLVITGKTDSHPTAGTLLTGDLFAFRSTGGQQMEFLYRVTGGELSGVSSLYGVLGTVGFVVLDATGFLGDFDNSFDNFDGNGPGTGAAVADTFTSVPEPGSLLLVVFGVVGLAVGARLRSKRTARVG